MLAIRGISQTIVRGGTLGFGDSSYNFDVEFDSPTAAFQDFFDARHAIGLGIIKRLNVEGIDLAYPTQTAFTAAPRGGMIPPYPDAPDYGRNAEPVADDPKTTAELKPSADRSAVDEDASH